MAQKVETEARTTSYNGAPAQAVQRPPVEVTVDQQSGQVVAQTIGGEGKKSRLDVIEAAKARRAQRGDAGSDEAGEVGSGEESDTPKRRVEAKESAEPDAKAAESDKEAGDDEVDEEGSGAESEEGEQSEQAADEQAAPDEKASDQEEKAAEEAKDDKKDDPGVAYDLEQARAELSELRERYETLESGRRTADFEAFAERPAAAARQWIADQLGVDLEDPLVEEEAVHLLQELTYSILSDHDVGDDKKAQLDAERLRRDYRLLQHRRQAEKKNDAQHTFKRTVLDFARRQYERVKESHPHLALASELDNRSPEEVIVQTIKRAAQNGVIDKNADDDAAFQEAIRLADKFYQQRATKLAARLSHLMPKPSSGASDAKAKDTKPDPSPKAAPKKAPSKPSTLPSSKASAPPSRPSASSGTTTEAKLDKKVVVDVTTYDAEERRKMVLDKHRNRGR